MMQVHDLVLSLCVNVAHSMAHVDFRPPERIPDHTKPSNS
jgi:hypothetical protein